MRPYTIAIIGAGFSGAMTAVQLMRQTRSPLRIVLVNKSGRMARGLAYGTSSPSHLLNVPAGNMSALPDAPNDFVDYCRWADPTVAPHSFVPRALYGSYLEALLASTESGVRTGKHATLERLTGEVLDLVRGASDAPESVTLTLDGGRRLECDTVVLAFGHFPPADVLQQTERDVLGNRYVPDPWSNERLQSTPCDADVLLIGNGLTALDVLTLLEKAGHTGRLTCVSRRGLMQHGHRPEGAPSRGKPDGAALARRMGATLRGQVRALRHVVNEALARGDDWRDVIGALRPHTPALWHALDVADRRRFLRHVQPYWDVLRHRCAPEALDQLLALKRTGRLENLTGRVRSVRVVPGTSQAELTFRLRGSDELLTRRFDLIVNCTGPSSNLVHSRAPLLGELVAQGYLRPDPLGLGLNVSERYETVNADGAVQPWLRYVGPMLKARDWEATAVPELRAHAQRLAADLLRERDARDAIADRKPENISA
jgi:uncharacterized NAD(P)/FAD-binding protein YdhS